MSVKILENLGYKVLGLTSSEEALDKFKSNPELFSLLITDQNMPAISGDKLVLEIRKLSNKIPIILCTGFSDTIDSESAKNIGVDVFVSKPLEKKQLIGIVNEVISSRKSV